MPGAWMATKRGISAWSGAMRSLTRRMMCIDPAVRGAGHRKIKCVERLQPTSDCLQPSSVLVPSNNARNYVRSVLATSSDALVTTSDDLGFPSPCEWPARTKGLSPVSERKCSKAASTS